MSETKPTCSVGLHNKYRPQSFDEVIGNEATVTKLKGVIKRDAYPSGILFTGPPGVGKTTMARVFANEVNGPELYNVNTKEHDFGSERSIEDVRGLIQIAKLRPAQGGKRRFVLGDEAHQVLSNAPAANALLKPLEEPVSTTTYMLCSMEADKFTSSKTGMAMLRRCLHIQLQAPSDEHLRKQALRIIRGEKMKEYLSGDTVSAIVGASNHSMSILSNHIESLLNYHAGLDKPRALTPDDVAEALVLGVGNDDALAVRMLTAVYARKFVAVQREILDVGDAFGFINKCIWLNWYVSNQIVLKETRHPKVWGTEHSKKLWKDAKELVFEEGSLSREQQLTIAAEVTAALTQLKMGSGSFAVDERVAISSAMWTLIQSLKRKVAA